MEQPYIDISYKNSSFYNRFQSSGNNNPITSAFIHFIIKISLPKYKADAKIKIVNHNSKYVSNPYIVKKVHTNCSKMNI